MKEKDTQRQQILDYLKQGYALTPLEALNKFGCFRLAAVVFVLKKEGHNITTETVTKNDKKFASYYLEGGSNLKENQLAGQTSITFK